jgi:hypothetical protein
MVLSYYQPILFPVLSVMAINLYSAADPELDYISGFSDHVRMKEEKLMWPGSIMDYLKWKTF